MMPMKSVGDVRAVLYEKLRNRDFVTDKTGVRTIELMGESFVADEESILGEVNHDWHMRELRWYNTCSLNVNDIEAPIPEIWKKVADKDGYVNSNYGWMIWSERNGRQFENAVRELKRNRDSRRAVMIYQRPSMWEEFETNGRSDFVCTNAVQYLVRGDRVNAVVQMRSSDLVFGYKGDRFWQRYVLEKVADYMNAEPGDVIWQAGSAHVYERHFYLVDHWGKTGEVTVKKSAYGENNPWSEWK